MAAGLQHRRHHRGYRRLRGRVAESAERLLTVRKNRRLEIAIGIAAAAVVALSLVVRQSSPPPAPPQISALLSGATNYSIDALKLGPDSLAFPHGDRPRVTLKAGNPVTLQGWAVDGPNGSAASSVAVQVDAVARVSVTDLGERDDVAAAFKNPKFLRSEFSVTVPPELLPAGTHVLRLLVGDAPRSGYYLLPQTLTIDVGDVAGANGAASSGEPVAPRLARHARPVAGTPAYSLDYFEVDGVRTTVAGAGRRVARMHAGQTLVLGGWAIDRAAGRPAGGVALEAGGKPRYAATFGADRPDVAGAYGNGAFRASGFTLTVPPALLSRGRHRLALDIFTSDASGYYRLPSALDVTVE